jgi:hypothetical protein
MNNMSIFKGWITTILGLIVLGLDIVHFFGLYKFPSAGLDKPYELGIALLVGFILLFIPPSKLEIILEGLLNWIVELVKKLITKKTDNL